MAHVICICNQKGGVGKTTTTVNLAACMALSERRTLVIDLDPQANASTGLGVRIQAKEQSVYEFLVFGTNPQELIRTSELNHLDILPSSSELIGAEIELVSVDRREYLLSKVLVNLREQYEYILIDCPPSLGFLTLNALVAADTVLVPIQCEYYALEGVGNLLRTIARVQRLLNRSLTIEGFLLTMFDPRNNLSHQVVTDVRKNLGLQVFETIIPRNVKLSECPSFGKPVVLYDITSRGAISYFSLAKEILDAEHYADKQETYCSRQGA